MSTKDAAIAAARRGWAVFPCRPGGKQPAVPDSWETRDSADPDRVERYWSSPRHNVGIACGPSGLVVLDLDCHGDLPDEWRLPGIVDGRDVLAQLCEWARQPWPVTHWVATPYGGWHLYFTAPESSEIRNSAGLIGPQVDVRAAAATCRRRIRRRRQAVQGARRHTARPTARVDHPRAHPQARPGRAPRRAGDDAARLRGLAAAVRAGKRGDRTGPLVWAAHRLAEMIAAGDASPDDGELLVHAAVEAGIRGGEQYDRSQVQHVLGGNQ